ncbi:MAG: hypothetical protein KDC02_08150 [Flavobacteriales bacterium]|nr:hypothetical protein [Flavobacteriales bacterium]
MMIKQGAIAITLSIMAACSDSRTQVREDFIVLGGIEAGDGPLWGRVKSDSVDFYVRNGEQWKHEPKYGFQIPEGSSKVFTHDNGRNVAVVKGCEVNVYKHNQRTRNFQWEHAYTFNAPDGCDEFYSAGIALCVRVGNKVKQYMAADRDSQAWEERDYLVELPSADGDIITYRGLVGLINGDAVEFYHSDDQTTEHLSSYRFQISESVESILVPHEAIVAVVEDNKIRPYAFDRKKEEWVALTDLYFEIPPEY